MKISFVRLMFRIFPMQMKSAPFLNSLEITLGMTDAAVSVGGTIAMQILFDTMTQAAGGGVDFWSCAVLLIIASAFVIGELIVNGVFNYLYGVVHGKAGGYVGRLLRSKLIKIDPALFENTEFLDDLNKAKDSFYLIPHFAMTLYHIVGFYGVYFIGIGIYLFHLKPILLLILLLSFIPALLAQMVRAKVFAKLEQSAAPIRREYEYYQKALCDREYYKETRILGAFQYFYGLFTDTMTLLTGKIWKAERKTALLQLLLNSTSFAGMAVACYMLFEATMSGEITIGAFAAIFAALGNIFYKMHMIITWAIGIMNKDIGKVAHFVQILDMPECSGESDTPDFSKGITAKDISFTYPGREQPAINRVSLHIAHGETIAIVGENGAGKSTLVRLLTGIFRPDAGNVAIGGVDTAKTAPASIYNGLSGVFQKYQKYKMTLRENVAISDIGASPTDTKIKTALREADVNLGHEVHYETMLSPEFNGIDLSGGQWQRLAIARGLYRVNGFIVLDEPTSAIDPIEETKIFMQFQKLAEGKCAVVVTHRLGSAKLAHRIVVMDGGRIVDMGTHEELLSRSGKYSDMWAAQAQWYRHTTMPDTTPLPVARGAVTTDFV